jgi:hypothetical protein
MDITALQAQFRGEILTPASTGYESIFSSKDEPERGLG